MMAREIMCWVLFFATLLSTVLSQSTIAPEYAGYAVTAVMIGVLTVSLIQSDATITLPKWSVWLLAFIGLLLMAHLLVSPMGAVDVIRVPIFIGVAFVTIFYLPQRIPVRWFWSGVSRISVGLVVIGLPPVAGVDVIGPVDLTLWHGGFSIGEVTLYPITSVFSNPNTLGFVTTAGTLGAAAEVSQYRDRWSIPILSVNAIGLFWTHYRTGWLVIGAAAVLYAGWLVAGRRGVGVMTSVGTVVFLSGLAAIFGLLPAPEAITSHTLNGRKPLWQASVQAYMNRPLLGYGLGPAFDAIQPHITDPEQVGRGFHSSYLRMFVATGVGGGIAYLSLMTGVAVTQLRSLQSLHGLFIFHFVALALIVQVFDGLTVFGLSTQSVICALSIGYGLQTDRVDDTF